MSIKSRMGKISATAITQVKISPSDTTVCYGEKITFSVIAGNGPAITNYNWYNGSGSQPSFTITAENQGYIVLLATNAFECISGDSAFVNIKNCDSTADYCVQFPNAFTPNKDGKNDSFGPHASCQVSGYQLSIFNRYCELVFATTDISKKWDGTLKGIPQDSGNYVFTCKYSLGGVTRIRNGFVVLLK